MKEKDWAGKHYAFFTNKECEFFPCHAIEEGADFNCLFCYCPLYVLGDDCGGNPKFTEDGIKDCSACLLPHRPSGYGYINERFQDIVQAMQKQRQENNKKAE